MKRLSIDHLRIRSRVAACAASLLLAVTAGSGCISEVNEAADMDWDEVELEEKGTDPCTNPSTAPVRKERWVSQEGKFGNALFVFFDYDKSSRTHIVPFEKHGYSHVYVVEVGSQSRDATRVNIIRRATSSNLKFMAGGGSTDKYQNLHEVVSNTTGSATFNQPISRGVCIRDEGQYVVIYTNKAMRQLSATARDPELTGHDNQYKGAPNDQSFSLIADDETNHPNRTKEGGATWRMLRTANFRAFEDQDNGFFLYKKGSTVPTFTGNGCDAQYEFSGGSGTPTPSSSYQAENRTSQSDCTTETSRAGYTGSGYADFGGRGSWIEWNNIRVPAAGTYELRFRYANADSGNRAAVIRVNGTQVGTLSFPGTGGWTSWGTASARVSLNSGSNALRVQATSDVGGPNIDRVDLVK